jgi:hypothetical protein
VLGFPTTEPTADSCGDHLRVLIANEKLDRLGLLAAVVEGLGYIEKGVDSERIAAMIEEVATPLPARVQA